MLSFALLVVFSTIVKDPAMLDAEGVDVTVHRQLLASVVEVGG